MTCAGTPLLPAPLCHVAPCAVLAWGQHGPAAHLGQPYCLLLSSQRSKTPVHASTTADGEGAQGILRPR